MRFFITVPFFALTLFGCKNTPQDADNQIDNELALRKSIVHEFCGEKTVNEYEFSPQTHSVRLKCGGSKKVKTDSPFLDSLSPSDKSLIKLSSPFEDLVTQTNTPLLSPEGIEELKYYTSQIGSRVGCSGSDKQGIKELEVVDMGERKKIRQVNFCTQYVSKNDDIQSRVTKLLHNASGKEISYVVRDMNSFETYLAWLDDAQTSLCGNKELSLNSMYNFTCDGSTYDLNANSNISKISTYSALDCPDFGFEKFRVYGSSYKFKCKG